MALIVQHVPVVGAANANTQAITVAATGLNNLLVVWAASSEPGAGRTIVGVSDGTSAFTQVPGCAASSGVTAGQGSDMWYLPKSNSGKTVITVTYSGAAGTFGKELEFWEVSGFTNPIVDAGNGLGPGTTAAATDTGAAVTTSTTNGFIAAGVITTQGVTANPKAGNEFTSGGDINANANAAASLISTTAVAHTPAWTDTTGATFTTSTAAFKETPTFACEDDFSTPPRPTRDEGVVLVTA